MPLPPADAEAIHRALATFDVEFRQQPEWAGWESNRAQTYVLVHDGRRYPPKKILSIATGTPVSEFSGGPEANGYLEQRGFKVERLRAQTLAATLRLILERYGQARRTQAFRGHHEIRELFDDARRILSAAEPVKLQPHIHVHSSYGKGNWATIPWISLLDDRETTTTQDGTYIVYLFREDGAGCYVKLGQGVSKIEQQLGAAAIDELGKRAQALRLQLSDLALRGFDLSGKSDMATDHRLAKMYEASTIAAKYYPVDAIPDDEALINDLSVLVEAYGRVVASRPPGALPATDERPIALVGTWKEVFAEMPVVEQFLATKGGWSSPWSFPIKSFALERLRPPFYLYANAGGGELPVRLRIDDCRTSQGSVGIESPWPDITEDQYHGLTRSGPRQSEVWKTWFRVGAIERLSPVPNVRDFDLVAGLSTPQNVLNQSAFGYVHVPDAATPVHATSNGQESNVAPVEPDVGSDEFDLNWLHSRTGLDLALLSEMTAALRGSAPQIILAGPPGTGKSWVAKQLARHLTGGRAGAVRFVQFHPGYSYESFVEGLRPVSGPSGVSFQLTPGVVLDVVRQMDRAGDVGRLEKPYVIVIDEFNRANLPRVLGELMYLFEYRGETIQLQYSPTFSLPANLYFICTMNTTDRSVRAIDAAMRRRFELFEVGPNAEVLRGYLAQGEIDAEEVVSGLQQLNAKLTNQLDRHHSIGHSFFMRPGLSWGDIQTIWDRRLLPLIEEFFYDQPDLVADYRLDEFWPAAADAK